MKANFIGAVILCVFVCSADQMTTVAQQTTGASNSSSEPTQATTEPATTNATTTEPPSNGTTEASTTAPTSMAPTTIPPPQRSRYEVIEKSKVCLIMEGSFQLEVTYMKNDSKTASMTVNVPESGNVTVTGICASENETKSSLTITPKYGEIKSLTFNFEIRKDLSNLDSWSAEVDLEKFPYANETELNHTANFKDPVVLSSPNLYFKCDAEGNFSDPVLAFKFRKLRVQAFNVENGDFSGKGYDCRDDVGPIPAPGSPPVNTYSVNNGSSNCIVFKGGIQFHIPYVSKSGNTTELVALPSMYGMNGSCSTSLNDFYTQILTITFYETWVLTMYFSSNKKQNKTDLLTADAGVDNYHISQIELTYDYNNNLFKDVDDSIVGTTKIAITNQTFLSTSASKSYMCNKDTTFAFENGLTMVTKNLQFQAFRTTNTTDFDSATECAGDEDTNSIVPIAVGAALAGLVIIVLIAYLIGRKRSRAGYEQV